MLARSSRSTNRKHATRNLLDDVRERILPLLAASFGCIGLSFGRYLWHQEARAKSFLKQKNLRSKARGDGKSSCDAYVAQKKLLPKAFFEKTQLWQALVASGSSRQKLSEIEKPALESSWRREKLLRRICCTKQAPAKSFLPETKHLANAFCRENFLAPRKNFKQQSRGRFPGDCSR